MKHYINGKLVGGVVPAQSSTRSVYTGAVLTNIGSNVWVGFLPLPYASQYSVITCSVADFLGMSGNVSNYVTIEAISEAGVRCVVKDCPMLQGNASTHATLSANFILSK